MSKVVSFSHRLSVTTKTESNHFQSDAGKYAAYLETAEGRLRLDLTFASLQEFLGPARYSLRVLDLGSGTGAMAVRLVEHCR